MSGPLASPSAMAFPDARPTLPALPKEILTTIALSLDLTSALSLATVCRALLVPAQHRIWSHLDLCLHKNHGEYPLIRPYGHHDHRYCAWAQGVALQAEKRHRAAVQERIDGIVLDSGTRRLRMVKSIKARPRAGPNASLAHLLTVVAPSLIELEFQPPEHHIFDRQWESNYSTSIFGAMLNFDKMDMTFPALTHVTIGPKLVVYRCTLDQILAMAPNLRYLDIDLSSAKHEAWKREKNQERDGEGSTTMMTPEVPLSRNISHGLVEFRVKIAHSGAASSERLERLLAFGDDIVYYEFDQICTNKDGKHIFAWDFYDIPLTGAQSLRVTGNCRCLLANAKDSQQTYPTLPGVYRLSVSKYSLRRHFEFLGIAQVDSLLEHLRIEDNSYVPPNPAPAAAHNPHPSPNNAFIEVQPCKSISPYAVSAILHANNLERIEFVPKSVVNATDNWKVEPYPTDTWQQHGITGSIIRSFTHLGEDLVHVRTWSRFRRIERGEPGYSGSYGPEVYSIKRYEDGGGPDSYYKVRIREVEELEWEDATDYKGLVVPLYIIGMMRKVDGKTLEEWQGRGVVVGEKAWKVLTDWAASQRDGAKATLVGNSPAAIQGNQVKVETDDTPAPGVVGATGSADGTGAAQGQAGDGGDTGAQGQADDDADGDGEDEEDDGEGEDSNEDDDDEIDEDSDSDSEASDY